MHLKLKVEEDQELRDYIKSLIKGQVISVAREEMKNIIKKVFEDKQRDMLNISPEKMLKEQLQKHIEKAVGGTSTSSWTPSYIKTETDKIILQEVKKYLSKS